MFKIEGPAGKKYTSKVSQDKHLLNKACGGVEISLKALTEEQADALYAKGFDLLVPIKETPSLKTEKNNPNPKHN